MCIRLNHHIGKRKCEEKKKKRCKIDKNEQNWRKKTFPTVCVSTYNVNLQREKLAQK
jgi:hypothetical protein